MNTILLFAALLLGTFLHGTDAASVVYTGNVTLDSPTWTRPRPTDCENGSPGSLVVGYTVESFNVLTTGIFDVTIEVDSVQDFDGYIFVYHDVFDPLVPDANLLGCSDDVFSFSFRASSVTVNLQCGTQYFVVTTAFDGNGPPTDQFGTFTNTISGHDGAEPVLGLLDDSDADGDGVTDVCDTDVDGDGIANGMDKCPLTPLNERPVTLKGCSINQLCPCKGRWSKHELYIACIARVTTRFKNVGVITGREKRKIQNKAARSACGKHMHEKRPNKRFYY